MTNYGIELLKTKPKPYMSEESKKHAKEYQQRYQKAHPEANRRGSYKYFIKNRERLNKERRERSKNNKAAK